MAYVEHSDYYIYKHTFSNGLCYIGKGRQKRAFKYSTRNSYWKILYSKYGLPEVTFLYKNLGDAEAYAKEIEVIRNYKESGIRLCNFTDGGDGLLGFSHSRETIEKIKKTKKLNPKVYTDEEKQRAINELNKYRELKGPPKKGAKLTDVQKLRISESHKGLLVGKKNPNYNHTIYHFTHNEYGDISGTLYELTVEYGMARNSLYKVVAGFRKSCHGFKLK